MAKRKLDLHEIYNRGDQREAEPNRKDGKNLGRIFIHFQH